MHPITQQWQDLRQEVMVFHRKIYNLISETHLQIMQGKCQMEPDLVDQGLLARECKEWFEDLRKEAQSREHLLGKILAANVARKTMDGTYDGKSLKGEFSSGSPKVKEQPKLPDIGSSGYVELMMEMGVPIAVAMEAPIKLDWQKTGDWFTKRLSEGGTVPECITKRYPVFSTQFRRVNKKVKGEKDEENEQEVEGTNEQEVEGTNDNDQEAVEADTGSTNDQDQCDQDQPNSPPEM